jgi:hypothetical protein
MDDGAVFPGLSDDVVVSNADATRCWRGQYLGGTREDGYRFKLEGVVRQADFGGGKLRVWEIGVGDEVRVPTHVSLRRAGEGRYELTADTALRLTLPGVSTMRLTPRGQGARELAKDKDGAFALTEAGLGVGVVALETAK